MNQMDISWHVREHASTQPNKMALVHGERRTTYAELNNHINQIANGLISLKINKGERVAVLDQNSDQFFEIWLAAARIGAITVPLNARLAPSEVELILKDCKPKVLFLGPNHLDGIAQIEKSIGFIAHRIETGEALIRWRSQQPDDAVAVHLDGNDICTQLYTSGTTGAPKGVQLTNRNLASPFELAQDGLSPWATLRRDDVVLVVLPHGHIAGCGSGLAGLIAGATVVVASDFVPPHLIPLIASERVTLFMMVPIMIRALAAALPPGSNACDSLRLIIYGAAPMAPASLLQAMQCFPRAAFGQVYGLTETTGPITYLSPEDHRAIAAGDLRLALSCGQVQAGVEVAIADATGQFLPAGETGEIVCRSRQIMRGYWNRPADNATVLRDGWFFTGDIGSVDPDGYVFLQDRKRDMIITGGENVFPTEVENALYALPGVAEAVVFGVPDEKWGEAVKAAVVLKPGQQATEQELLGQLRCALAGFKLPKSIDFVDSLPKNPTGKILRRALREPYWAGHARQVA